MRNIKIKYEYDGTDFFGMQKQEKARTVAGEIEKILNVILKEKINLINSGRTDRGVHALEQVSNFLTESRIPVERLEYALKNALPKDINLFTLSEAEENFNARFSAKWRSYIYKLSPNKDIFQRNRVMFIKSDMDVEKFNNILRPLIGEHDFGSFRKADCGAANGTREIYELYSYKKNGEIHIYIKANSFLKSMVRIIVGSALAVYFGEKPEDYLVKKLENPNMQENGKIMAEAQGLYLYEVAYD